MIGASFVEVVDRDREVLVIGRSVARGRQDRDVVAGRGLVVDDGAVRHRHDAGVGVDREQAAGIAAEAVGDRGALVDIGRRGGDADERSASGVLVDGIHRGIGVGRTDDRILRTRDVDMDVGVGAVGADHVEIFEVVLARREVVVRGARSVGPLAVGTDREGAIGAGRSGLRHEGCALSTSVTVKVPLVEIVLRRIGLRQGLRIRGQHRGVIGAVDGDGDDLLRAVGRR